MRFGAATNRVPCREATTKSRQGTQTKKNVRARYAGDVRDACDILGKCGRTGSITNDDPLVWVSRERMIGLVSRYSKGA